jgi:hypothetical protein
MQGFFKGKLQQGSGGLPFAASGCALSRTAAIPLRTAERGHLLG